MEGINILDIVVICLTVLLLLFGLWRGMFKMIYGLISSLLALVLAIVLVSTVVGFVVQNTQWDDMLAETISTPISGMIPNAQQKVNYYDMDGNPDTPDEIGYDAGDGKGPQPFENLLAGSKLSFLSGILKTVVTKQVDANGETAVLTAITAVLVSYILMAAAFIALWILIYIVVRLLCLLFSRIVKQTYIGYYLNKILGGVLGAAVSLALVFAFLTVVRLMGNYEVIMPVNDMIESSTVTKLLAQNNFLYGYVANVVDIQSIIDKIMESIAKVQSMGGA